VELEKNFGLERHEKDSIGATTGHPISMEKFEEFTARYSDDEIKRAVEEKLEKIQISK
jgi:hypothetical protein